MTAYAYTYTGNGSPSTVRRTGGDGTVEFPQDPGNRDYQIWQAFIAGGGTTTPAASFNLGTAKTAGIAVATGRAKAQSDVYALASGRGMLYDALRFGEAVQRTVEGAGGITFDDATDFPLLKADVTNGLYANIAASHAAATSELATLKANLINTATGLKNSKAAINAATDQAGIDAALAASDFDG